MRSADVADADVVIHHALQIALEIAFEQAHEEVDFGAGAAQVVFERKGIKREPGQADAGCCFGDELDALGALLMAEEAFQRAMAGPTAVPVHDDGHVFGEPIGFQRRIGRALFRGQLMNAQRARRIQRTRLDFARAGFGSGPRVARKCTREERRPKPVLCLPDSPPERRCSTIDPSTSANAPQSIAARSASAASPSGSFCRERTPAGLRRGIGGGSCSANQALRRRPNAASRMAP